MLFKQEWFTERTACLIYFPKPSWSKSIHVKNLAVLVIQSLYFFTYKCKSGIMSSKLKERE